MPYKEKPVEKLFYTIGEVAEILKLPVSTIRYWENEFEILKPSKNKKGNRLFMPDDLKNLKIIHHLLKEKGMTMAGARKQLAAKWEDTEYRHELRQSLTGVRELLIELRDSIDRKELQ